jgi:hypothetical protein
MHSGFVAIDAEWSRLLPALASFVGPYDDQGPIAELTDDVLMENEGDVLIAGSLDGKSYILDKLLILSCESYDRIGELSGLLGATVVAIAGETVSGTFSLCVAENGVVRRVYHNCVSAIERPFSYGDPLPVESGLDLEDIDGEGLLGVARSFGLEPMKWLDQGEKRLLSLEETDDPLPEPGPIDTACKEHWTANEREAPLKPKVVARKLDGGGTGFDVAPGAETPSLGSRIKRWLGF